MIRILSGVVAGGLACGIGTIVAALTLGELLGVSQAEGAFAMGVVFTLGPLAALGGAVLGGLLGAWSSRRARARRAAQE